VCGLIERQEQALEISAARNLLKMGGMGAGAGFAVTFRLPNPVNTYGAEVVVVVVDVEVETSVAVVVVVVVVTIVDVVDAVVVVGVVDETTTVVVEI